MSLCLANGNGEKNLKKQPLLCLTNQCPSLFVQNHCVLDRHENMLCKRVRFLLLNGSEYMGLKIATFCNLLMFLRDPLEKHVALNAQFLFLLNGQG